MSIKVKLKWRKEFAGYRCSYVSGLLIGESFSDWKRHIANLLKPVLHLNVNLPRPKTVVPEHLVPAAIAILRFNGIEVEVEK